MRNTSPECPKCQMTVVGDLSIRLRGNLLLKYYSRKQVRVCNPPNRRDQILCSDHDRKRAPTPFQPTFGSWLSRASCPSECPLDRFQRFVQRHKQQYFHVLPLHLHLSPKISTWQLPRCSAAASVFLSDGYHASFSMLYSDLHPNFVSTSSWSILLHTLGAWSFIQAEELWRLSVIKFRDFEWGLILPLALYIWVLSRIGSGVCGHTIC